LNVTLTSSKTFQFIVLALVSAASAARLDKPIYLPPSAGSSGGANAGLQAPFGAEQGSLGQAGLGQGGQASAYSQAEILNYENEINEEGYRYAYETSDGTKAEQQGEFEKVLNTFW
ncbi:pupal cuticle protein 36a-like, partial [Trichoplusia ni]|uniref:Pupal cuticle protein 36a-like n=1 Tax=Trichoplusia ni TaxID=7111 RepID=A0A7E5WDF0_TRINI